MDEALHWLRRSTDRGCLNYPFLSGRDLLLSNLRGDPAFGALMERIQRDGRRSSRESCRPKWPLITRSDIRRLFSSLVDLAHDAPC